MKPISVLVSAAVVALGVVFPISISGATEMANPAADTLAAAQPSSTESQDSNAQIQVAAEPQMQKGGSSGGKETSDKGAPDLNKDDCDDGPDNCMSIAVAVPNQWGCTTGSRCSIENKTCNQIGPKKCKTQKSGGTCYCSCVP